MGTRASGRPQHQRAKAKAPDVFVPKYQVDEEVEGNFGGGGDWYKATIRAVNLEWRYYDLFYTADQVVEQKVVITLWDITQKPVPLLII